jgi:hypothetical protein
MFKKRSSYKKTRKGHKERKTSRKVRKERKSRKARNYNARGNTSDLLKMEEGRNDNKYLDFDTNYNIGPNPTTRERMEKQHLKKNMYDSFRPKTVHEVIKVFEEGPPENLERKERNLMFDNDNRENFMEIGEMEIWGNAKGKNKRKNQRK